MNRPDHPDFWLMAEVMQDFDQAADEGADFDRLVGVDTESLFYGATQRSLRIPVGTPVTQHASAAWIDGFVLGMNFQRRKPSVLHTRTLVNHWPDELMGSQEFVVFCGCGAEFRERERENARAAWAEHVGKNIR